MTLGKTGDSRKSLIIGVLDVLTCSRALRARVLMCLRAHVIFTCSRANLRARVLFTCSRAHLRAPVLFTCPRANLRAFLADLLPRANYLLAYVFFCFVIIYINYEKIILTFL